MAEANDSPDRRGEAGQRIDRAKAAREAGSPALAGRTEDEAIRTDPEGVANELQTAPDRHGPEADDHDDGDEAVHAITGTVQPGAAAPSRAGIGSAGSGADDM